MAHSKFSISFSAGSLLLAQLLAFGPVSAGTPQLVKTKDSSAVYWITGQTRSPFPLSGVYKSWFGTDFSLVSEITPTELTNYTLSKNVLFKTGSLIKIQTDPKVYQVVNETGALEWIPSEEEFKKRGLSFKDVMDVPDSFFSDYHIAQSSDFATPQNSAPTEPTSPNTLPNSAPNPVPAPLAIQSSQVTSFLGTDGQTKATVTFSTNVASTATFEFAPINSTSSTVAFESNTTFSKTVAVLSGISYNYVITAKTADGKSATTFGTFTSYSDIVVAPVANLVPADSVVAKQQILVGGFTITNKSSSPRTTIQALLEFDSGTSVITNVTKTIQIVRLNTDKTVGDVVVQKTVPSGTPITNASSIQKIAIDETIAPGETKQYGIVLQNLDQINLGLVSPSDTFVPFVMGVDFLGDTTVNLSNQSLAKLIYYK